MIVDRYQLGDKLSDMQGISTHLGVDPIEGREVVVKIIPAASIHAGSLMRLEYEATHLQRLRSRWLSPLLHVAREADVLYLVSELALGQSLKSCLEQRQLTVAE